MNQPTLIQPNESLMAVAMCNLAAYRQVAQVTLDSTERLEKIGLAFARNVMDKSFAAAENAGNGQGGQVTTPDLNDWLRAQREIGDTLVNASQQLARTMTDYGNRLNQTLASNKLPSPAGFLPSPVGFGPDAIVNFWNQTYERYGEMVKEISEGDRPEPEVARATAKAAKEATK
jgi:hypothetical protein